MERERESRGEESVVGVHVCVHSRHKTKSFKNLRNLLPHRFVGLHAQVQANSMRCMHEEATPAFKHCPECVKTSQQVTDPAPLPKRQCMYSWTFTCQFRRSMPRPALVD